MDDLLNDLGENMTYQDLYKRLTGYDAQQYSEDSDASSESVISKYDYLNPPLYTYEELTNNTVGSVRSLPMELSQNCANEEKSSDCSNPNSVSSSDATINTPPADVSEEDLSLESSTPSAAKVAKDLLQLITVDYCFICSQPSEKHYKHESHYKSVMKWLEIHTKEIMICNLPLSGHDQAKIHYEQKDHNEKSKSFCEVCSRAIDAIDMPNHRQSKKHLAKIKSPTVHKSPAKEITKNPSEPSKQEIQTRFDVPPTIQIRNIKELHITNPNIQFTDAHPKHSSANLKSYASALKGGKDSKRTTSAQKAAKIAKSELLAMDAKYTVEGKSAKSKPEMPAMFNPLAMMLVDQLRRNYCHLCDEPVHKGKGYHYKKKQHYEILRKWIEDNGILFGYNMKNIESVICFACHLIFPTFDLAQTHYTTKEHEKVSKSYCESCMVHDNSDIHKNHNKRHLDKGPNDEEVKTYKHTPIRLHPEIFVKESIKNMLSETYCHICNTDNRNNHYLSTRHIEIFRVWLDTMILNSGTLLPRPFIFCESCDMNLLETDESVNHYQTLRHLFNELKFCEVCIFRGSPEEMVLHRKSASHYENYKYLPRSSRTPTESASSRSNIEGRETNSENRPEIFIAQILKEMLAASYCQICEMDNRNNHKFTKEHVQKLRRWLDEMVRNTGEKLNLRLIFCEDCNIDLRGTLESVSHYRTTIHLYNQMTYCATCIFRGRPEEVVDHHHSDQHHETLRTLFFNKGVTVKTPNGVRKDVVGSTRDVINVAGGKKGGKATLNITEMNGESEKIVLKEESQSTKENGESRTSSDKKNISLVHLGLRLGENAMKNVDTERKDHKILCEDIFVEYWHMVTMLEMIPLDVCLSYLRKFTKELGGIYKQHLNNKMDADQINSLLMSYDTETPSDPFTQDIVNILNCETSKLTIIATTFLDNEYCSTAVNELRRVIMLVRNLKKAIDEITAEKNSFKIDSVFQFNNTLYPYKVVEATLDAAQYEIYKDMLKNEITHMTTFINTQKVLNRHVLLHCLAQFNNRLIREICGDKIVREDDDDDLNDDCNSVSNEFLADAVDLKTEFESKNVPVTRDLLEEHVSSIKNNELNVPDEIVINNDRKTENDSDMCFESAVECSCEGWCKQKNKN